MLGPHFPPLVRVTRVEMNSPVVRLLIEGFGAIFFFTHDGHQSLLPPERANQPTRTGNLLRCFVTTSVDPTSRVLVMSRCFNAVPFFPWDFWHLFLD